MLLRDETLTALGTFDLLRVDAAEFVRPIEHPHFGQRVLSDAFNFLEIDFLLLEPPDSLTPRNV
jgi:hypothetical protein